ncbi:MAG: amidase [Cyclobacteriaceae bacterium]|nr:amidase [Cyclobacteriaceae bacterium]
MHLRYKLFVIISFVLVSLSVYPQAKQYPTDEIEVLFDLSFTDAERDSMMQGLRDYQRSYQAIHSFYLTNDIPMSLWFNPVPANFRKETVQKPLDWGLAKTISLPANREELAFYPVYKLAVLIRTKKITSTELTKLYIDRIKKYADTLQCVVTLLEETALAQARRADEEIARGKYRGPLHGIPYGIKDLLAVEGTKTTWGAEPYMDQQINTTATVVKKLEDAGAVLVVKLTLGALAMGDIWFGGVTKNPWNLRQGSSGSSAGSASATVAGLVAFSIGTETLGSIVSPSTRCGASGLRPTFGTVSRHGAMALSWSMDKIGPICRSAWDAALVYFVIRGEDPLDKSTAASVFNYDVKTNLKKLRIGYFKTLFDATYPGKENDQRVLEVIRALGIEPEPVELPAAVPVAAIRLMLTAEAAAAFDELTRSNKDSLLSNQLRWAWPNTFRTARFIPAVEYINASRMRQQLIEAYHKALGEYDVIISPSFAGTQLLTTNLTGHPCVVVPNGFNENISPTSISFLGKLYGEAAPLLLARAYQEATEWEDLIPEYFKK